MKIRQARKIMQNVEDSLQTCWPQGSRPWMRPVYRGDTIAVASRTMRRHWFYVAGDIRKAFTMVADSSRRSGEALSAMSRQMTSLVACLRKPSGEAS